MTPIELYDWLLAHGVKEPAVMQLGETCFAGRWENVSEELPNGHICRSGKVAVHVIAEGATWEAVFAEVEAKHKVTPLVSRALASVDAPIPFKVGVVVKPGETPS